MFCPDCLGGGARRVPTLSLLLPLPLLVAVFAIAVTGVTGCRRPAPPFYPRKCIHLEGNYSTGSYFLCDRLSHALCSHKVFVLSTTYHYIFAYALWANGDNIYVHIWWHAYSEIKHMQNVHFTFN